MKLAERWRVIPSFPEYVVSTKGRVKRAVDSQPGVSGYILKKGFERKPVRSSRGYESVGLTISTNNQKTCMIHNLVLEAFVGPRPPGYECNHKDGNKTNNHLSNLEWVTHSENARHAYRNGLRAPQNGENNYNAKLKEGEVWLIKKLLESDFHLSKKRKQEDRLLLREIAKMFKVSLLTISSIKQRRTWKHI
jgi:hypothetical protein